jgi:hypothetical protein
MRIDCYAAGQCWCAELAYIYLGESQFAIKTAEVDEIGIGTKNEQ